MALDDKSTYYDAGGIETIAVIKAKSTPAQYAGYLHCVLLKYPQRSNFKGQYLRDVEKIHNYSGELIALVKEYGLVELNLAQEIIETTTPNLPTLKREA